MFPKIEVPQNGWFRMENLIKMDDWGGYLFLETPISILLHDSRDGAIRILQTGFLEKCRLNIFVNRKHPRIPNSPKD